MASGIALVAVVGWGLIRSSNAARDRAEWAASRDARDLALAMRAALRQPAVLELCDEASRFAVVDGEVVIDERVGWIDASPARPLDSYWQQLQTEAQRAEFAEHDPAKARALFDELLARLDDTDSRALPVITKAAWLAHRTDELDRSRQLIERVEKALHAAELASLGDPHVASALASSTLLATALGIVPTEARQRQLAALPEGLGTATLQRLEEFGTTIRDAQQALERCTARRRTLQHASTFLRQFAHLGSSQASRGQLVLWFPGPTQGSGHGAIVAKEWLARLPGLGTSRATALELTPIPDRGEVSFRNDELAEPIVASLAWATPPPLPQQPWFTQPTAVLTAGIGLLLLFAGTVWATMRGLSRENAAMRARTEFLSGVTHELKTPVAAMRLIADVLHDDDVKPQRQREYFAMMAAESARLSALIDNVLDLGQIERGERSYDLRTEDAADVVREAVRSYTPLGRQAGLVVELREGVPTARAKLDRGAIIQALLNLLENARKYASAGKRIDVETKNGNGQFTILVRDHGPGVPASEREAIFQRFQRGKAQASGSVAGVGLGLFLSRSILEYHGGTLTCTAPEAGPGSVFQLTVPLLPSPPPSDPNTP